MDNLVIFDLDTNSDVSNWVIINDSVMGGKSKSNFYFNEEGQGIFEGEISLENNGGFCSVKCNCNSVSLSLNKSFILRLRGDNKQYQFRVKTNKNDAHSYVFSFQTSGEWQTISIPIEELYPAFRGEKLAIANYDGSNLEEIAFLFGNKETENFKLLIESIKVQ
jgi:hypothetical protein